MTPASTQTVLLIALVVTISSVMSATAAEGDWKRALQLHLPEFESATGIRLLTTGPAETVAAKFRRLQNAVAEVSSRKQALPVFIDPTVALEVVPAQEEERLGSPLLDVPVEEALKLMCERLSLRYKLSESGILIFR